MLYLLLYLFLEVLVSVEIASAIGALATFAEIVLSAFLGIFILLRFQQTLSENMRAFSMRQIDWLRFQELNLFTLLGAVLLIIPGFLTDIVGIAMQFSVITGMLVNRFSAKWPPHTPHHPSKDSNVIDVEIISDHTSKQ
ncbi:MAG: FxsA family protein [Campylobacterales bacterium]|nr:FxsA family protein [Campylobacterales bacterium]